MEDWIASSSLITLAGEHGHQVSARSLELWRYRGLLPRGARQPTGRASWLFPPSSERQLVRLLHWRERTRSLDLIRVVLWVEGFEIELDRVRESLSAFLDSWTRMLDRELGQDSDISGTIDLLARKAAGKRGKGALPRNVRMSTEERRRACGYALAFMLNAEDEIARRRGDRALFERMLGMRSGHGGGMAGVMPLDEDTLRMARLPSPGQLATVLRDAPAEELELVRRITQMIAVWMPLLLPVFLERYGAKAVPLVDIVRGLFDDLQPHDYAFAVLVLLMALHAQAHAAEDLRRQLEIMTPAMIDRDLLAVVPESHRATVSRQLSL